MNVERTDVISLLLSNFQKDLFTAIVGHVVTFDPLTQRAQVQIGVQRVDSDGNTFEPNPIADVPVQFVGGINFFIETQIDVGAEGLIIFSQRALDGWKQTGNVGVNPVARFHHMQDAVFVPGVRSLKTAIQNFQNDGTRIRNKDGSQYLWVKKDQSIEAKNKNGFYILNADGSVNINGTTIDKDGNVKVKPGATITDGQGVVVETHKHPYDDGITGVPQA